MAIPKEKERYTYADYCTWDDDERWEIIDGVVYAMSPAPTPEHQSHNGELSRQIANFLKGKPCKVFSAPFDVRLNADAEDDTVVQPDIVVICDKTKLDKTGCIGAPDMVVETLSPSSVRHDRITKLERYQRAGVPEYWIVDTETKTVSVHILENGKYYIKNYNDSENAPVHVLEGCEINLQEVFTAPDW